MPRYFLQISFHGKKYHGWQIQENAHSVQAELNSALQTLLRSRVETLGCCRTDTGVHALVLFVHFDCDLIEKEHDFLYHLNCLLPLDIAAQKIFRVADDAHARFNATSRTYKYFIHRSRNPFINETSYYFPYPVDVELMNDAAKVLLRHNDYSCFTRTRTQVKSNVCHIRSAEWTLQDEQKLVFEITADRFLRTMVRAVVGTMLMVGEKKITVSGFEEIILGKNRSAAGESVPGHGLFLTSVTYPFPT